MVECHWLEELQGAFETLQDIVLKSYVWSSEKIEGSVDSQGKYSNQVPRSITFRFVVFCHDNCLSLVDAFGSTADT